MKTDIEIEKAATLRPITEIAEKLGLSGEKIEQYGKYKAKIPFVDFNLDKAGKLVLVTAINPTPAGEGKTTVSIGLADAFNRMNKNAVLALREPSMGPVFGMKGGAAGGGYAQVAPMEEINLHFTGDIHAMTTANNLISAILDNHIFQGNELDINPKRVSWHRAMDMNDRALRDITIAQDGLKRSVPRADHFDITVASEIMAVFCLAVSLADLKQRLARIVVAFNFSGQPVTIADLGITDAVALILKDALKPNLVQTLEGTPAFVHGGPFANIAHGCNSVLATQAALTYGDIAVTEAGFGADLGAEKFLDIKSRQLGKAPDAVVIVATVRALKYNGGVDKKDLNDENLTALESGFANLARHVDNLHQYVLPVVVAINRFPSDTEAELELLSKLISDLGVASSLVTVHTDGGAGAAGLAEELLALIGNSSEFQPLYDLNLPISDKITRIVQKIYHGKKVNFSEESREQLSVIEQNGWSDLPVCIAKTQYSFSDNPKLLGAPSDFEVTVRELAPRLGAGFIVVYLGSIIAMPGLPKHPAALDMHMDDQGKVTGLS
ncbi:formate--tetrahydrofolate ligase [Lactovum odontotermitis]